MSNSTSPNVGYTPNLHVYFSTWNAAGFKRYLDGNEAVVPDAAALGTVGHGVVAKDGVPVGGSTSNSKSQSSNANGYNASSPGPGSLSSSHPKSWKDASYLALYSTSSKDKDVWFNQARLPSGRPDPNARDWLGRTVLHLVCSSTDPRSYDFLTILLAHPHINVNLQDGESGWTALHRAMWVANLRAARELLGRADIELSLKDNEGLTAMDLWNSTCVGTNPADAGEEAIDSGRGTDLFMWGSNRNFTLGLPDPADRALPERVNLLTRSQAQQQAQSQASVPREELAEPFTDPNYRNDVAKFDTVGIKHVSMGKFHTGVLTTERRANLSICGFGSNGRLGKNVHTQYSLLPLLDLDYEITAVALGQDHTLAVTSQGFILSWGSNRFSQLGYAIEQPETSSTHKAFNAGGSEEQYLQVTPKRIIGSLKKEFVIGVAASRLSSACWTADSIWTWGTNSGHLGYEKAANPVQTAPRKVTSVSQPVLDLAMTDYALACLVDTNEVLVLHHDVVMKINFPTQRFPSDFSVYRPPQFVAKPTITKITSSGHTFAALSSLGDVFTFTLGNPIEMDLPRDGSKAGIVVRPQMVWALRKRFTAVKDVALGPDGAVIVCTHSGHVYVRQRQNKQLKFKRIPYLQRVIKVAANESGSFAAIRFDAVPSEIKVTGLGLQDEMLRLLPHMRRAVQIFDRTNVVSRPAQTLDEDEDDSDASISHDIDTSLQVARAILEWSERDEALTLGADMWIRAGPVQIPAHQHLLSLRIPQISELLMEPSSRGADGLILTYKEDRPVIEFTGCSPMAAMILLQYFYSDDISAVWDSRVLTRMKQTLPDCQFDVAQCRRELVDWASRLHLDKLRAPLSSTGKVAVEKTLAGTLINFFESSQRCTDEAGPGGCDLVLQLSDRKVYAHSSIMIARCPFFDAMYGEREWTVDRQNEDGHGRIVVNFPNLRWRSTHLVMRYIHDGLEEDIFDYTRKLVLGYVPFPVVDHLRRFRFKDQATLDEFIDFVFEVMAAANMLLLDRLVLVCSRLLQHHVTTMNAAALATEAAFHNAVALKISVHWYIACNLETMLENRLLDEMDIRSLNDLAGFAQSLQGDRLPVTRSGVMVDLLMEKHGMWMFEQDIPQAQLRSPRQWRPRPAKISQANKLPLAMNAKGKERLHVGSARRSNDPMPNVNDDIFSMDDEDPLSSAINGSPSAIKQNKGRTPSRTVGGTPWKSPSVESHKSDLRSIMAETSAQKTTHRPETAASTTRSVLPSGSRPAVIPSTGQGSQPSPFGTPLLGPVPDRTSGAWRSSFGPTPGIPSPSTSAFPSLGSHTPSRPANTPTPTSSRPVPASGRSSTPRSTYNGPGKSIEDPPGRPKSEVIVPVRRPSQQPRKASEAAWNIPVTFSNPIVPSSSQPVATPSGISLLAIQEREKDFQRLAIDSHPQTLSLKEIQEQEKAREAERTAEAEFQRWWDAEEARLAAGTSADMGRRSGQTQPHGRRRGAGGQNSSKISSQPSNPEPSSQGSKAAPVNRNHSKAHRPKGPRADAESSAATNTPNFKNNGESRKGRGNRTNRNPNNKDQDTKTQTGKDPPT